MCQWVYLAEKDPYLKNVLYQSTPPPRLNEDTWIVNLTSKDAMNIVQTETFWKYVFVAWCEYTYLFPMTIEEVKNQFLWYNSHVRIGGKLILYVTLYEKGCKTIQDMLCAMNQTFMTFEQMSVKYL